MVKAQQITRVPFPQQVGALPMQATTLPAQTNGGFNIDSIMNLMLIMVVMVMMMKMVGKVGIGS